MPLAPLPIDAVLPEVLAALRTAGAAVLRRRRGQARPRACRRPCWTRGSPAGGPSWSCSRGGWLPAPAARRMAFERGGRLGDEIGYQVRFDRAMTSQTRIQVVTEGILLRMLQDAPFLESVGVVVFDEFHERSLNSDLALAMVRRVQQTVRPDLKLLVMSATLAARADRPLPGRLPGGGKPGPAVPGRGLLPRRTGDAAPIADRAAEATRQILDLTDGDVLVFLPGVGEIRQTARRLQPLAAARNLAVLPLYGDLPAEKQDQALAPVDRRKVVLATNVAETSITIEGITGVVDTGVARSLVFDPRRRHGPAATGANFPGVGRATRRPRGSNAAGRVSAALARADPPASPAARRAGNTPARPGRPRAAVAGLGRDGPPGVSLVRAAAGRRACAGGDAAPPLGRRR